MRYQITFSKIRERRQIKSVMRSAWLISCLIGLIAAGCNKYSRPDNGTTVALVLLVWCGVVAMYHIGKDIFRK